MKTPKETRRGRPPKGSDDIKGIRLDLRISAAEKEVFCAAADKAGQGLSAWIRDRLMKVAKFELQSDS